ncbi:MAG: hypothetical protein ACM3NQ_18790, partial [Bacteroidales bacterium]
MNMTVRTRARSLRHAALLLLLMAAAVAFTRAQPDAQAPPKKAMTIDDYTKWRSIDRPVMSADGKWVAYTLQNTNVVAAEAKPVLHLLNLDTNADVSVADGTEATFSPDSKWVAYQVAPGGGGRGRGGRGSGSAGQSAQAGQGQGVAGTATVGAQGRGEGTPPTPPRRVELRNVATGDVRSWQDIGTFAFSATSDYMWLRRRGGEAAPAGGGRGGGGGTPPQQPPTGAGAQGAGAAAAPSAPRGVEAVVLDLRTGNHQVLASVADIAFNRTGELLAYTVDSAVKDVNGLFVFDTRTGRTITLDADA